MRTDDEFFMKRALALGARGDGKVSPNPLVGSVIVRDGKIVAEGWHKKYGGAHAEINAMRALKNARSAGGRGKKMTLYINLEPCIHTNKKTPPCVPALIACGLFERIVIATKDSNPKVRGRGIRALKSAGIQVEVGCMEREARLLNEKFFTWMGLGRPFVGMKVAMSLDGKIATREGHSKWITSNKSRVVVHKIRDEYDAILVGIGTVLADNPMLKGSHREPLRVILDSRLRIPLSAHVLRDTNVLIATTRRAPSKKLRLLEARGIQIYRAQKRIALAPLLRTLAEKNISSVLVEGGSEVFGSFISERLIDRAYFFVAPMIIAGRDAVCAVGGRGIGLLKNAIHLKDPIVQKTGDDYLFSGRVVVSLSG